MAATKQYGYIIESLQTSQHLTDSYFIKGGYIVVNTIAERDALPIDGGTAATDGIIVKGSLVYVAGTVNKSYRYDGTAWVEDSSLPSVTSSDNGKVLTVVNGGWSPLMPATPATVGELDTTNTNAQATNASESFSGHIDLHKIAKTGTYSDLLSKPTDGSATIATVSSDVVTLKAGVAQNNLTISNSSGSDITLAKVAKTGSYNDLSNKPTIPTVGSLNTNSTAPLNPSSSESFGNTINLHKISKTGTYADLRSIPSFVHLYNGDISKTSSTSVVASNFAEAGVDSLDIPVGDIVLGTNGVYGKITSWNTSTHGGTVTYVDNLELSTEDITGVVPTTKGGTGISALSWYSDINLRPHFEIVYSNDAFLGKYFGPLTGITDVASALQTEYVKLALQSVIPIRLGTYLTGSIIGTATVMTGAFVGASNTFYILFPDSLTFSGVVVNGFTAELAYDSDGGLYFNPSTMVPNQPYFWTNADDVVAEGMGSSSIGNSHMGIYWDGSSWQTTDSIPSTAADIGAAPLSHSHTSDQVTKYTTDATIATNDKLAIFDADASNKLKGSSITFNTSIDNKWLCQDGTWSAPSGLAPGPHSHGYIENDGTMSDASDPSTIVNGDRVAIVDTSGELVTGNITFDGSTTTQFLSKKGSWESIPSGPMVFKGTVGDSGAIATIAWTTLLSSSTTVAVGDTYKVVNAHSTTPICKAGDTIICTTGGIGSSSVWTVIPSGDEPSGTVTNIATGTGLTGGPITSTGTISHADTSSQASVDNSGVTFIQDVTLDDFGHVTGLGSKTITKSDITGLGIPASDTNTTYSLSGALSSHKFTSTLTAGGSGSGTSTSDITLASGSNITLTDDTANRKITIAATDTTYTFAGGTNGFTVTPSGGTAIPVTVTPSIINNITGSGTNGSIAKFSGANTITDGPAFNATHNNTFLRKDGEWATPPGGGVGNSNVYEQDSGGNNTLVDFLFVNSSDLTVVSGPYTNGKKLVVPTVDTTLDSSSNNAIANSTVTTALNGKAASDHVHGNIDNGGRISSTVVASTTSDYLLFADASNSNKIERQGFQAITSTLINSLGEGTSPNVANDYLITQYAGGGTSNTTYYRRKLSNVLGNVYWGNTKVALSSSTETTPIFASTTSTNVNLRQSSSVTTVAATMSYDATEEAIKFTFA